MQKNNLNYFLAANSCQGFVSFFDTCYDANDLWKVYIIKGGPGTGKSSFMRKIAVKAENYGFTAELCPCSSDPSSLDAVILPQKKIVIMDGTSPHTVDPRYPAVCEEILNFGDFWNTSVFEGKEERIISITNKNKTLHQTASRYLKAAGNFFTDNFKTASACTDNVKVLNFAKKLCKKYIPAKRSSHEKEWVRFLNGTTPNGIIGYSDTLESLCDKNIIISDEYGSVTDLIMKHIREYSLSNGYEIITVKNAFLPDTLTDGIIIPELSLSFIRETEYLKFNNDSRRIHARRFVSAEQLAKSRKRIKFNKKAINKLLSASVETLSEAKAVHDILEKEYIEAMDFESLNAFAEEFAERLFL